MGPKKKPADPHGRQLPVRFSGDDVKRIEEMQTHLEADAATIIRWAVRYFRQAAEASQWQVTTRGEPLPPRKP